MSMRVPFAGGEDGEEFGVPAKVVLVDEGREHPGSAPEALTTAVLANQNAMLAVENARLARENMIMRMRSQGMATMPYPGENMYGCLPPPWGMPPVSSMHQDGITMKNESHGMKAGMIKKGADTKDESSLFCSIASDPTGTGSFSTTGTSSFGSGSFGKPCSLPSVQSSIADAGEELEPANYRTTVMMRNLPNNFTRAQLLQLIDDKGFHGQYTLMYLPVDFKTKVGLGYAFIDFSTHERAEGFLEQFQGFNKWPSHSDKVCEVDWSKAMQGLSIHVERYRNSPVMHEDVADEFKPVLFKDGARVPFPEPTRRIRAPRQWPRRH